MAGSIIDSLYIQLGIDVSQFKKGKDEALKGLKDVDKQETEISNKRTKRTKDNSDTLKKASNEEEKSSKERLKRTKDEDDAFGDLTKTIAGFGTAMLGVASAKEFLTSQVQTNLQLGKTSRFLGESAKNLKAWGYAAEAAGGNGEEFLNSVLNIRSDLAKAKIGKGGYETQSILAQLGVTDEQGKDAKEFLMDLGDSLKRVRDERGELESRSFANSLRITDDGYVLLTKSRKEIDELYETGKKQAGLNDEQMAQLQKLNESWKTLKDSVAGVSSEMLSDMTPALKEIIDLATSLVNVFRSVNKEQHDKLDQTKERAGISDIFDKLGKGDYSGALKTFLRGEADNPAKREGGGKIKNSSSSGISEGNANPDEIISFFKKKGWTEEQAKGIAANIMRESNGNPNALGDNGLAYGLAQHHPDRQKIFNQVMGKDIKGSSVQDQLTFIDWELKNTEKKAGDALKRSTTAGDSARTVSMLYERPANTYIEADRRAAIANNFPNSNGNSSAGNNSNGTVQTHIDTINVITQAKDAVGVANSMREALAKNQLVNFGMQGAS